MRLKITSVTRRTVGELMKKKKGPSNFFPLSLGYCIFGKIVSRSQTKRIPLQEVRTSFSDEGSDPRTGNDTNLINWKNGLNRERNVRSFYLKPRCESVLTGRLRPVPSGPRSTW